MIKSLAKYVAAIISVLIVIILVRTTFYQPNAFTTQDVNTTIEVNQQAVIQHLSEAIQFKTVSYGDKNKIDLSQFNSFKSWLALTYPEVHQHLEINFINDYSLLLKWHGKNNQAPVLLSAHYDVVPVQPGTETEWKHPPFSGTVADDYIWGRGALDDKSAVIALLESVTSLINAEFQPQNDVYIAFTHDEEIGSELGAKAISQWMTDNKVKLAWSLDEGSFVLDGLIPGIEQPVASINVAEKGYLTLELTARGQGGHSSMPPQETAVTILADAILKLRDNPVPGGLTDLSAEIYDNLGRNMSFGYKVLFANTWLFAPVIEHVMGSLNTGNAMLRTTTAPTMLSGSVKANVLPITATATVNFRLHPRDTVEDVISWVNQVIADTRVSVKTLSASNASKVADDSQKGFQQIAAHAQQAHGDVVIASGLTIAATDSRYYSEITDSYRFNPMVINNQDLAGFHGTNERISIDNMIKAVQFYTGLIQQQ